MGKTVARRGDQAVERTPAKKTRTIVESETSTKRVGKLEYQSLVRDSLFKAADKSILWAASTRADMDGKKIFPKQTTWATDAGVSRATIQRRVPELTKQGYLRQVSSGKGSKSTDANEYELTWPTLIEALNVNASLEEALNTKTVMVNASLNEALELGTGNSMPHSEKFNASPDEATRRPYKTTSTSTELVDGLGTDQTGTEGSQESLQADFPVRSGAASRSRVRTSVPDFDSLVPVHPDNARRARVSVPAPIPAEVSVPAPEVPVVSVVPPVSVPTVPDTTRKEDSMAKPKTGSFRSRMQSESVFWSDEELDSLAEALGTDSSDFGLGFRKWLDGLVDFGQLDKDTDLEFVLSHAKVCSTKKPSPVGYFKISLEDRLEQFKSEGQSVPAPVAQNTPVKAPESPVAASIPNLGLPAYVKGDLVSHAVSEALMAKLDEEDIVLNEKPAWLFWEVQRALKAIKLDENYANKIDEFRDGNGEKLSLDEFARRTVNYFWKNAAWADCSTGQAVVAMYLDPTNLRTVIKNLKTVYKNRRAKNGIK